MSSFVINFAGSIQEIPDAKSFTPQRFTQYNATMDAQLLQVGSILSLRTFGNVEIFVYGEPLRIRVENGIAKIHFPET